MNVFEAIATRRSIRKFQKKSVDEKLIGLILYMATFAPSAGNTQEWEFVIVDDEEVKKKIAKSALDQRHVIEAPINIVVCADLRKISLKYGKRGELLYALQDTANATMLILLASNALGLGTCWTGAMDEEEIKGILGLPDNLRPVAIIPVGYPAEKPEVPRKIPFENITHVNRYGNKIEMEMKSIYQIFESLIEKLKKSAKVKK